MGGLGAGHVVRRQGLAFLLTDDRESRSPGAFQPALVSKRVPRLPARTGERLIPYLW